MSEVPLYSLPDNGGTGVMVKPGCVPVCAFWIIWGWTREREKERERERERAGERVCVRE